MTRPHRKKNRTFKEPGHAHELTFSCFQRLPLLNRDRTRQWFIEALETTRQRLNLALWAYVIMPEHIHVLVWPRDLNYEVRLIRTGLKVPCNEKPWLFCEISLPHFSIGSEISNPTAKSITASGKEAVAMIATSPIRPPCGP